MVRDGGAYMDSTRSRAACGVQLNFPSSYYYTSTLVKRRVTWLHMRIESDWKSYASCPFNPAASIVNKLIGASEGASSKQDASDSPSASPSCAHMKAQEHHRQL